MSRLLAAALVLASAAPVLANPPTQILGRVLDPDTKRPLEGASVVIDAPDGTHTELLTDENGLYHLGVPDGGTYRIAFRFGETVAHEDIAVAPHQFAKLDAALPQKGEVINVHDHPPPVLPKPLQDVRELPPYSEQLATSDTWVKQWLLLDVDEQGRVSRLKYLNRPPTPDLEKITLTFAFALKFTPARDDKGRAIHALLVWPLEWPSYGWLVEMTGRTSILPPDRMPRRSLWIHKVADPNTGSVARFNDMAGVPCMIDGKPQGALDWESMHPTYRDCSKPDLDSQKYFDWIAHP